LKRSFPVKLIIKIAIGLLLIATASAQEPAGWHHIQVDDPLHGKVHDTFALEGRYLTPPRTAVKGFAPSIVVSCSDGKLENTYVNVGAVIVSAGVPTGNPLSDTSITMKNMRLIEARLDGTKVKVLSDPRGVSTDHKALFLRNTGNQLKSILNAHQVIFGVDEYLGSQVVMQFDMPNPSPVVTTCSKERSLQAK
jgi:hypothetical protein